MGVESGAEIFVDDVHDLFFGEVLAIGAFGGEGFEGVGDGEYADFGGKSGGVEAAVVAFAVEAFVVGGGGGGDFAEAADTLEYLAGVEGMAAHQCEFGFVELSGFIEDKIGDAELSDVVEEGGAAKEADAFRVEAEGFRDADGNVRDTFAVAIGPGAFGVDDLAESDGNAVEDIVGGEDGFAFGFGGKGFLEQIF